jgi:hypothetical protein
MEQIVIAYKKIKEVARLLVAANERALLRKRRLSRSRWTEKPSNKRALGVLEAAFRRSWVRNADSIAALFELS